MSDIPKVSIDDELLLQLRADVVDRLLVGVLVIAVIAAPVSISRAFTTGWMHLYTLHVVLASMAIATYLMRRHLAFDLKLAFILALFVSVGIGGLVELGLLGVGMWWLVITSLLISVLYSPKLGLYAAITTFFIVLAVAWCFVNGVLFVSMDANIYIKSWSAWLTLLIATSLMPFFVFQTVHTLQSTTHKLLQRVMLQRDEIHQLATYDDLTGLLRPHAFSEKLQTLLSIHRRGEKPLALMYVDLDKFKEVNDTYGHQAGDCVLKELATRYQAMFRTEDAVGRIGGDEFVFALGASGREPDVAEIAKRVVAVSTAPIVFGKETITVGASVGISIFPDHAEDEETLRKLADRAMYKVKDAGKNDFMFASPDMAAQSTGRQH